MKTERELTLLEEKFKMLRVSIDDMPELKFVTKPELLATVKVNNGEYEFDLSSYHEVVFVGNQAINTNATAVNTIVDVLLMSYLNQKKWKDVTAFSHGLIGTVTDFGALSDIRSSII